MCQLKHPNCVKYFFCLNRNNNNDYRFFNSCLSQSLKRLASADGSASATVLATPRRRLNTEGKTKVVAAAWEAELNQILDVPVILHQDDLQKRMNYLLHIIMVQNTVASAARS